MKWSQNVPLSSKEMKRLPLGFTATSFGTTGQEFKKLYRRGRFLRTNRARTNGRTLQYVPIYLLNDNSEKVLGYANSEIIKRFKSIWHRFTKRKKK